MAVYLLAIPRTDTTLSKQETSHFVTTAFIMIVKAYFGVYIICIPLLIFGLNVNRVSCIMRDRNTWTTDSSCLVVLEAWDSAAFEGCEILHDELPMDFNLGWDCWAVCLPVTENQPMLIWSWGHFILMLWTVLKTNVLFKQTPSNHICWVGTSSWRPQNDRFLSEIAFGFMQSKTKP